MPVAFLIVLYDLKRKKKEFTIEYHLSRSNFKSRIKCTLYATIDTIRHVTLKRFHLEFKSTADKISKSNQLSMTNEFHGTKRRKLDAE